MRAAIAVLLVALPAHATWRSATIAGTPTDLDTLDAGVMIVSSTAAMAVFGGTSGAGIAAQQTTAGNFLSATWRPPSCVIGLLPGAAVQFAGSCTAGSNTLNNGVTQSGRLKRVPSGAIYAHVSRPAAGQLRIERADPTLGTVAGDWAVLTSSSFEDRLPGDPFSTLSVPTGGEYVAWGSTVIATPLLTVYVDGGVFRTFNAGLIRDVTLFERDGGPAAILVNDAGQVLLNNDLSGAGGFINVEAPVHPYNSVTFTMKGGSGFGMLTHGNQVYGPVPNPNAPGIKWVLRTEDAGFPGNLARTVCYDPSYCAAIVSTGAPNVFAYFNDFAPGSDLRAAVVPVGGTATYVLDAGDPDGDPIWVTWTSSNAIWDGGDPRVVTVVGPAPTGSCLAPTSMPLVATLSDGLAAHDRQISIPVTVTGTGAALALIASPTSLSFTAGGVSQSVAVDYPPDSGCTVPALSWSISPDGGLFTLVPGAAGVAVTPPAVFCRSTAQTFTLTAVGSPDASVSVPVTLEPWGAPNAPVFAPATLTQPAGSTATYAPTAAAAHACAATGGFPGADLVWLVDGGAPSVTVSTSATQVTVSSTDSCISASVDLTAKRRVNGFPTQLSLGAGHLEISLVPDWKPITAATAFDAGFSYDDAKSQLVGNFSTAANCADQRDLRAQVSVAGRDGGYVNSASGLPVPGAWSVNVPGGCSGGRFVATASLIDDAGTKYGATATYAFEAARIAARVPSLSVTEVPVSCAEGARGSLSLDLMPTDCAAQTYSWAQDIGPALVVVPDGGSTVSFATATQDLQAQAGQELGWSITATTGVGNSAVASRKVRLVPAPFVQISHRTDVPVAREEELVGVEVILTNPTACAVTGVVLRESLGGLKPVTGSVRVTGAKPEVTIVGDVLEVPGLALPALGSMSVTYLARVPLLSRARPRGQVLMTGADVTIDSPVTATGCGCDASSAGGFALMVLAAAMLRSRKRS